MQKLLSKNLQLITAKFGKKEDVLHTISHDNKDLIESLNPCVINDL